MRFLFQWWRSERAGDERSAGRVLVLQPRRLAPASVLCIHRQDPVFFVGQLSGFVVYLRNLQLIHRAAVRAEA